MGRKSFRHSVTINWVVEDYLSNLVAMGIYGRSKSEVIRRFVEGKVSEILKDQQADLFIAVHNERQRRRGEKE